VNPKAPVRRRFGVEHRGTHNLPHWIIDQVIERREVRGFLLEQAFA